MALYLIAHQENNRLYFDVEVSQHMLRSLRKKSGDVIQATDGKGTIFTASIDSDSRNGVEAAILKKAFISKKWEVHVACSLLKQDSRFEYFLEKATETGVHRITPLICERTLKPGLRLNRAQKIIHSAVQQSFNPYVPILDSPIRLDEHMNQVSSGEYDQFIPTAVDRDEVELLEQQYGGQKPVHILIGPEGDFTPAEVDKAVEAGWQQVSLGENRLRTETAATMVVQIIKSCYHIKNHTAK